MPDNVNVNMHVIPNEPVVMDRHLTTAEKSFPKINFACQNVCSLNIYKPSKKTHAKLAAVTRCGAEIILLSDTRLNSDKQIAGVNNIVKKLQFLGYSLHHNSSKNSRGVAILLSSKFSFTIQEMFRDDACNILLLKIECGSISLTVGSIYGPNTDDIVFFNQLNDVIKRFNSDYAVIGGDWNTTVDGRNSGNNLDTLNTVSIPSARRSLWLNNLTTNLNLTDPYRHFFPDVREFTYVPFALDATNRSRLDFFLVSNRILEQCVNCRIPHNLSSLLFDHKQVFLSFRRDNPYKKQVINDTVLKDEDLTQVVNITALECYVNHLIPSATISDLEIDQLKLSIGRIYVMLQEVSLHRLRDAELGTDPVLVDRIRELVNAINNEIDQLPTLEELQELELSCSNDIFLEVLIMAVKNSSLAHQHNFF